MDFATIRKMFVNKGRCEEASRRLYIELVKLGVRGFTLPKTRGGGFVFRIEVDRYVDGEDVASAVSADKVSGEPEPEPEPEPKEETLLYKKGFDTVSISFPPDILCYSGEGPLTMAEFFLFRRHPLYDDDIHRVHADAESVKKALEELFDFMDYPE